MQRRTKLVGAVFVIALLALFSGGFALFAGRAFEGGEIQPERVGSAPDARAPAAVADGAPIEGRAYAEPGVDADEVRSTLVGGVVLDALDRRPLAEAVVALVTSPIIPTFPLPEGMGQTLMMRDVEITRTKADGAFVVRVPMSGKGGTLLDERQLRLKVEWHDEEKADHIVSFTEVTIPRVEEHLLGEILVGGAEATTVGGTVSSGHLLLRDVTVAINVFGIHPLVMVKTDADGRYRLRGLALGAEIGPEFGVTVVGPSAQAAIQRQLVAEGADGGVELVDSNGEFRRSIGGAGVDLSMDFDLPTRPMPVMVRGVRVPDLRVLEGQRWVVMDSEFEVHGFGKVDQDYGLQFNGRMDELEGKKLILELHDEKRYLRVPIDFATDAKGTHLAVEGDLSSGWVEGNFVRGQFVREDGKRVRRIKYVAVNLKSTLGFKCYRFVESDSKGHFEMWALPLGSVEFVVSDVKEIGAELVQRVQIEPGTNELTLTLKSRRRR